MREGGRGLLEDVAAAATAAAAAAAATCHHDSICLVRHCLPLHLHLIRMCSLAAATGRGRVINDTCHTSCTDYGAGGGGSDGSSGGGDKGVHGLGKEITSRVWCLNRIYVLNFSRYHRLHIKEVFGFKTESPRTNLRHDVVAAFANVICFVGAVEEGEVT